MLIDAHVHLQPHGERPSVTRDRVERYVEAARQRGLDGVVFTEHLFRFHEAYDLLAGWWNDDPNPQLAATAAAYWQDHVNLRMSEYVALIERAKADGLPVFTGLEMDWLPGRAEALRRLLAPYAWDLVLGSVHWIGSYGFDIAPDEEEWQRRGTDRIFAEYGRLIAELADAHLVDVLAHPDLPKLWGHRPSSPASLHETIVAAAVRNGCALEINTNGLNKPVHELYPAQGLLTAACRAGVPVTLASDAHTPDRLGQHFDRAIAAARAAGYGGYQRFARRRSTFEPFA